jgi:hypothetical protein
MNEPVVETSECQELKNIKYKSMLLNGVPLKETKSFNTMQQLETFLNTEKETNKNEPWCKLNKTLKNRKLSDYVEKYKLLHNLTDEESKGLLDFFKECLHKKKLSRIKDVIYDNQTGVITDIPSLLYNSTTKHFTLKNNDKRIYTMKTSLPKKNGTLRNITTHNQNSSSEDIVL